MDKDRFNYLLFGLFFASLTLLSACNEGPALSLDTLKPPMGAKFPPLKLESVTPVDGATKVFIRPEIILKFSNQVDATFITVVANTSVCAGSVQLSKNDFFTCETLVPPYSDDGGYTFSIWSANNLDILTNYKIKVTGDVKDTIGNNLSNPYISTLGFVTEDNIKPEVETTSPPPGAVDVDENTNISINFTKPMNSNTVTTNIGTDTCSGSFQLSSNVFFSCIPMASPPITSPDLKTFTINPLFPLNSETTYQIRALKSIKDIAGNNLASTYLGDGFTVKDWIKPTVTNVFPQNYSVEVPLDTPIIISFSEEMDQQTINVNTLNTECEGSIQLSRDNFTTCTIFAADATSTNGFTFTANPLDDLTQGSLYQIKVTQNAKDLAGNGLETDYIAPGFHTVALPYVVSVIPASGEKSIPYDATITVTFNKSMDPTSVFTDPNSDSCSVGTIVVSSGDFTDGTCIPLQRATASNANKTFTTTGVLPFSDQAILKVKVSDQVRDPLGYSPESNYYQNPPWQIIDTTPPEITSSDPNDGQLLVLVNTKVTLNFSERIDVTSISGVITSNGTCDGPVQLSYNDFVTCLAFDSGVPNFNNEQTQFIFTPNEILDTSEDYKIKVTTAVKDTQENNMAQDNIIPFQTVPDLNVSETNPPDTLDPLVPRTTDITVTFNRAMNPSTITAQTVDNSCTDSIQVSTIDDNFTTCVTFTSNPVPNLDGTAWTITPQTDLLNFTSYKIRVLTTVEDIYGSHLKNTYIQTNGFKTEDTVAPTVASTVPNEGDTNVNRNTDITVVFDEPMDPLSITTNTVNTTCTETIQVSNDDFSTCVRMIGQPTSDPTSATWTVNPANTLENFTPYKIKVTTDAKDQQGNNLENDFEQPNGFTTIDDVPPLVVATTPASGTTGVPVDTNIIVEFSEDMDGTTINAPATGSCGTSSVQLQIGPTYAACVPIAAISPTTNSNIYQIIPVNDLANDGTIYRIFVNNTTLDAQGNPLGANYTSTFRSIDEIPPSIVIFSPSDGSNNQNINREISITFSEDIDTSTLITNASGDTSCIGKTWYATDDAEASCFEMNPYTSEFDITFRMTPENFWPRSTTITVNIVNPITDPSGATLTNPTSYTFVTNDPGQASMTTPVSGATEVLLDSTIDIFWDRPMNINTMTLNNLDNNCSGNIQVSSDDFATTNNCVTMNSTLPVDLGGEIYQLTPLNDLDQDTTYTVRVTPSVLNMAVPSGVGWPVNQDFNFTTTSAPIVTSVVPLNGFVDVSRSTSVTATFNKDMDPLTITTNTVDNQCMGSFQLSTDPGFATATCVQMAAVPTQVAPDEFSVQPAAILANQIQYFFKVTTAAQDLNGQGMESDFLSNFTTIDDVAPILLSGTPSATNTIPTTGVSATFNETMDTSTFSTTSLTLPCDNSITFQVSGDSFITCLGTSLPVFSNFDTTISATPTDYLPNSSIIEVRVLSTVRDLAGNPLGADASWNFTTGDAPIVATIDPVDEQEFVDQNAIIQIDFNKAVNQGMLVSDIDSTCSSGNVHLSTDEDFNPGNCLPLTALSWSSATQATLTVQGGTFLPETTYFFRVDNSAVEDLEWNLLMESNFDSRFSTVSNVPPNLILPTIPANGAVGVRENQTVQIAFDKDMDGSTVFTNNGTTDCDGTVLVSMDDFITCHPLNAPIPASNSDTYTITLASPYLSSTVYKLKVLGAPSAPTATADPSGNYLTNDYEQDPGFLTGDFIIPYVVSTDPTGTTNTNPEFRVEFNEEMVTSTLSTLTGLLTAPCPTTDSTGFLLAEDSNFTTCVPMTSALGQTSDEITFNFALAQGLKNNTTYWYQVSTHPQDKGGNNVATPTVVSFTVNDPLDNYPMIISPADKATNVSYDTSTFSFELSFDKEVDPLTVTNNSTGAECVGNIQLSRIQDNFSQCVKWATAPTTSDNKLFNLGTLALFLDQNTTYVIKVSKDIANATGTPNLRNDYYFSFSTAGAPHVTQMEPPDGTLDFPVDGSLIVKFDKQMDPSTITGGGVADSCVGGIDVSLNSFSTCVGLDAVDLDGGFTFQLNPLAPYTKTKTYRWRVTTKAKDVSGQPIEDYEPSAAGNTFTIGNFVTVVFTNPENEETGVSSGPTISIFFSEGMVAGSVFTNTGSTDCVGSIRISNDNSSACLELGPATGINNYMTFNTNPVNNLPVGNYTVTVTTEAVAVSGVTLNEDYTFQFSTGNPPEVDSHSPTDKETGVQTNTDLIVNFSEAMNASTVTTNGGLASCDGNVQLKAKDATDCIPLANPINAGNIAFSITPSSPLASNQEYEVSVLKEVQSALGLSMFKDYMWTFSTGNTLARFDKENNKFYGKGIRCSSKMESKLSIGKNVKVSWKQNKEKLVNSLGGGYEVFYKKGNDLFCQKVPYIDGEWTPNLANLKLSSGKWVIRVKAYSRLNKDGSAFSSPIILEVP